MTFILTAIAIGASEDIAVTGAPFILDRVIRDDRARSRAGYLPGLARYLEPEPEGTAFHILLAGEGGWKSSDLLFEYPDDG
ncbi:MAG: hypothetical protein ACREQV_22820, partial [Candidatus Binatia bacterium]